MGYSRCKVAFAICADYALKENGFGLKPPDIDGFRARLPERWKPLVIGPVPSVVNGYVMYVFLWDGSKEGWADAEAGDELRRMFIELFSGAYEDGSSPYDVLQAEFRWGGDEPTGWGDVAELEVMSNVHHVERHPNHGVTSENLEWQLDEMERRGGGEGWQAAVEELRKRFGFTEPSYVEAEVVGEQPAITAGMPDLADVGLYEKH